MSPLLTIRFYKSWLPGQTFRAEATGFLVGTCMAFDVLLAIVQLQALTSH